MKHRLRPRRSIRPRTALLLGLAALAILPAAPSARAGLYDPNADWHRSSDDLFATAMLREPAREESRTRHAARWLNTDDIPIVSGASDSVPYTAAAYGPQPATVNPPGTGAFYSCGYNANGAVGDGTTTNRSTLVPVTGLPSGSVNAVAAGTAHTLYVVNGAVYAVGNDFYGQLGNGQNTASGTGYNTPQTTQVLTGGVTNVAAGYTHSLAVQNGALYAWGSAYYGQLGNGVGGGTATFNTPQAISNFGSGVTAIAASYYNSYVVRNGTLYATGGSQFGQLGNGTTLASGTYQTTFTPTTLTANVSSVAAGYTHALAIVNGGVFAWGNNSYGQLGNGNTTNQSTPTAVLSLSTGVTQVAAGYLFSMALQNGNVFMWGNNQTGQAGNGTANTTPINAPIQVDPADLKNIIQIAAGEYSAYALAADGSLWVWGRNNYGQLGDGTTTERDTPVHILPPSGYVYTAIDADGSGGAQFGHLDAVLSPVATIPEPSTWALLVAGLLGFVTLRRRRSVA